MTRRYAVPLFGLTFSLGALWVVAATSDFGAAAKAMAHSNPLPLAAIIGIVVVQLGMRAYRWSVLLPAYPRVAVSRLLPVLLVGYLGNSVLPARLGEPMRAIVVARREAIGTTEALGSVALERAIDFATLAIVAFAATLALSGPAWAVPPLALAAAAGAAGLITLATVGLEPLVRIAGWIGTGRRSVSMQKLILRFAAVGGTARRPALLIAVAISGGAWLLDAAIFWCAGLAVGAEIDYPSAVAIAGITVLGTAVPSAPGYVGTFELAAVAVATSLGAPPSAALAMAILAHISTLAPLVLGGVVSGIRIGLDLREVTRAAESASGA